ncbi:MAG: glycosyltransferase family 2 protein [Candidatus Bathyarchaeia archaeon]
MSSNRGLALEISIFIPVYKESDQISGVIKELVSQNVSKEIFVTVDEPTAEFSERIKQFQSEEIKLFVNEERRGKANALNEAAKLASGKVLLFLDSDVQVSSDPDFLKKIIMEMQMTDVLDIKKEVSKDKSFLSRMAYYEYFTFNVSAWLSSRYMNKCPCVNGAAFAIKKETFEKVGGFHKVVAEDIDLATRVFLQDGSFAYTADVEVKNIVYSDWNRWFKQRRRWAIGQGLWTIDWYRDLIKKFVKKPQVFLPSLFFLYPTIAIFLVSALMPSGWMYNSLLVFSLFLSFKFNIMLPIFLVSLATANLLKILIIMLSGFALTAVTFYGLSRKIGFNEMKLHELFVYYFFYSNLWIAIQVIGFFQVIALHKKSGPGWKT